MQIIPAIDIKNGKCVRLYKGDFKQQTIYGESPIDIAMQFKEQGAKLIHIVDLDGAKSMSLSQAEIIKNIVKETNIDIQTGGGLRTTSQLAELFAFGIKKVVIGSLAVKNPDLIKKWIIQFGAEKIVLAFDIKMQKQRPMIAINGWQKISTISLFDILKNYQNAKNILCTDIDKDGTLKSPNFTLYKEICQRYPNFIIQASGGVSSLNDLKILAKTGVDSVIIGKAFYEHKFTLKEACKC